MKLADLKKKSSKELQTLVEKHQERLKVLARESNARKQGDNIREKKNIRKEIARAKTLLNEQKD